MRELDPEVMGIIVTAYASVESAVDALREGAYDYITKPFANDHLKAVVRNALEQKALFRENRFLRRELREKYRFENIIGKSDAIEQVFRLMEKVARTDSSVLITGESGTGKELVARAIHFTSERANARFLPINCGALPENLLESELFGYKRGAFTGATQDKIGLLKAADKGTICSTRSARCRSPCRSSCCARCRSANVIRWAPTSRCASTCACCAPPTATSNARSRRAASARSCSIASTSSRSAARAARAQRRYPAARQPFPAQIREAARTVHDAVFQGRDARDGRLRVAGQCARTGKRVERAAILAETDVIHAHDLPDKLADKSVDRRPVALVTARE